jgi:cytochrome c-type biogenesis protein CcmE
MLNKKFKTRLWILLIFTLGLTVVVALVSYALRQNISLYYTPSQIFKHEAPMQSIIRVGGMVMKGSILQTPEDMDIRFKISDYEHEVVVHYRGILPDLFREGQGIVVKGRLASHSLIEATEVLAKHDENYMPAEVRASLKAKVGKA